ncbi:helix-turn-helix transcriptional regulator [Mycobacterium sp. MMS18-G62]
MSGIVSRPDKEQAVVDFLRSAAREPSALLVEGAPGIGKTTLCVGAIDRARQLGFRTLTTRPAQAESVAAYSALADLLGGLAVGVLESLPEPQLRAVDQVLLRADETDPATEPRAVAAAFLSAIETLANQTPVLIVVDDAQWLDPSSVFALDYAARRFSGRIGVLATVRTGSNSGNTASWLHVHDPRALRRITLPPFTIGKLSELLNERLGTKISRPTLVRIHDLSGGNPFYAIELGRAAAAGASDRELALPDTLSELVQARIGGLPDSTQTALFATACLATPRLDVIARAIDVSMDGVLQLLEPAEAEEIIRVDGNRVRFSHPLLAWGMYESVVGGPRRAMHRRLADAVDQPELRARHLAHGVTTADEATLSALDEAAQLARSRGAPAAAAELLDLAIDLGGDEPERVIRSAAHHFESGDSVRAQSLLEATFLRLNPGPLRARAASMLASILMYGEGFGAAAGLLERSLPDALGDDALLIQMLTGLAYMLMNTGRKDDSIQRVNEAVEQAERLGDASLLSSTLGMRVVLQFMCGRGVDEDNLQRALSLDDGRLPVPVAFQPRLQRAVLRAWTGELDDARDELRSIERRRIDNGEENESVFISYHRAMVEIWRGDFPAANDIADKMMDRAAHLEGDVALFSAVAIRSSLAAYAGKIEEARRDARVALEASTRSEGRELAGWMTASLGFLEVTLGNYVAALAVLQPVVDSILADPDYTEIIVASGVSDAVEAMIQLHRTDEAAQLIALMERNGKRLDRAWMLAVALRGRAMVDAAGGDVAAAVRAAEQAMEQHGRLPMPFERARTQLLLGQLQRRQRKKQTASATLREALDAFERMNTPLWAARARADLERVTVNAGAAVLTPSERRVAELAASGMTNRAIAAEMFISPKTVDTNLSRIYRKLGIHSRAELARWISENFG